MIGVAATGGTNVFVSTAWVEGQIKRLWVHRKGATRAFPPGHPQPNPLSWGGKFSEIPPVVVVRLRLR